jgi:protein-tyrosine phosphatase
MHLTEKYAVNQVDKNNLINVLFEKKITKMKILMVCLGNICRSPLAQGILEEKIKKYNLNWEVDSAGTSGWHDGEAPDHRARSAALKRGFSINHQISRKITRDDLLHFDLICAMDAQNYSDIKNLARMENVHPNIELLMNLSFPGLNRQVPDPYYDGRFDEVCDLLDGALEKFVLSKIYETVV